jgi:predicted amidophosphoribosyltransferase
MKVEDFKVCAKCMEVFPEYSKRGKIKDINNICPSCGSTLKFHTYLATLLGDDKIKSYLEYVSERSEKAA